MSSIDGFADDLLYRMFVLSPDLAAEMGYTSVGERLLPQDTVLDFSDEASAARTAMMSERAANLPPAAERDTEEAITHSILRYVLEDGMFGLFRGRAGHRFLDNPYPVNHITGHHTLVLLMLTRDHVVRSVTDAESYLSRLAALPIAIAGVSAALKSRAAAGIVAPRFTLQRALDGIGSFVQAAVESNPLVTSFAEKLESANFAQSDRQRYVARAQKLVTTQILPAYAAQIETLKRVLSDSEEERGVWSLPDGDAYYAWLLRGHTTSDLSPDEVHEIGLEEAARLQGEILSKFASLGISAKGVADAFAQLGNGANFRYPPGEAGRLEVWSDATNLMRRFESRSKDIFRVLPRASLELVKVPRALEDSMHTHYTPPSTDDTRPGRFSLNVNVAASNPRWELATLCAHEGTPGHHLQLAIAQALPLTSTFRRAVVFNAYIEGWAKYAETIPETYGWLDDPYAQLGRQRAELYSTVNLAMDTGIHARRWTRAQAREFFRSNTGVSEEFAGIIADRCFVTPGQLCSYKIGMIKFAAAKKRFEAARGDRFDVREFHDCALAHGALPLRVFDEVISREIARGGKPLSSRTETSP